MRRNTAILLLFLFFNAPLLVSAAMPLAVVLQKAAQGDVKAQVLAGDAYAEGKGITRDYTKAFNWYEKAANQGYAQGQRPLGVLYELGRGVEKDLKKAAYWYEKAALQGVARAQVNLGILYEAGLGVPKDYTKAFFWYEKAANHGYGRGMNQLALLYEKGLGVKRDISHAIALYKKGASAKYSKAMLNLGRLYSEGGAGMRIDLPAAVAWYQKAVAIGYLDAEVELRRVKALAAAAQDRGEIPAEKIDMPEKTADAPKEQEADSAIMREKKEEIQSKPPLPVEKEGAPVAVPQKENNLQENEPQVPSGARSGEIKLLAVLFIGSVVVLTTGFLLCIIVLKQRRKNGAGEASLLAGLESDIKKMRREIEQLSRVYGVL